LIPAIHKAAFRPHGCPGQARASTIRIGAFRTALIMNLEPLTAMVLSTLALGEVITTVQALGSGIMFAALAGFQLWHSCVADPEVTRKPWRVSQTRLTSRR